jgi:hypothetical protein
MSELQAQLLKSIGSASNNNNVVSANMCVSKNGDIYVFGGFEGTLDIGANIAPIKDTNGYGYIAKYNSSLAPIGLRQILGTYVTGSIFVNSLATSSNGDLYATGFYSGTLSIGGIVTPIKSDLTNGFLAKYNSDFTPSQLISINSTEISGGYSLAISSNDDVYITGFYGGTLTIGSFTINSTGIDNNGFLAKYNSDLIPSQLVSIDSTEGSIGISLAISTNGDVYITGGYDGTLSIDSFTINSVGTDSSGFLAKYNSDLTPSQLVSIDSTEDSFGTSLAISTKGDVYVAGTFKGTLNIGGGITATSDNGGFIAKYNSDLTPNGLNYITCTVDTGTENFFVQTIKLSSTGDVYVNGVFTGTIDINGITATTNVGGFIVKYNSSLNPISLNVIVNQTYVPGIYILGNMALTLNDELYVTGPFGGTVNIGDGVPTITIPDGIVGSFIAKYSTVNIEPICLVAGTPIHTDQGIFAIERLDRTIHTIGRKRIVSITKAITPEKHLICFEAHSLAINCPTKRTIMTPGHEVLYKGKLVQAKHFLGKLDGVHTVPYDGKTVYNVLQEKHGLMVVNNMTVETLHPQNKVAKKILDNLKQS